MIIDCSYSWLLRWARSRSAPCPRPTSATWPALTTRALRSARRLNCDDSALDDTPVGGLDQTDLGGPLDETNNPPADTSVPPAQPPCGTPATPAPAAPAPTNAAPPAAPAPAPGAPTGSKAKWVRIKVRVGDTVRKIAKRRGHPEHAAAIVKRNRKVKGKRTIRSRRTKLRHGSGATKATRKKDRRKLWVPAT